jgi:hypothetical protein
MSTFYTLIKVLYCKQITYKYFNMLGKPPEDDS